MVKFKVGKEEALAFANGWQYFWDGKKELKLTCNFEDVVKMEINMEILESANSVLKNLGIEIEK